MLSETVDPPAATPTDTPEQTPEPAPTHAPEQTPVAASAETTEPTGASAETTQPDDTPPTGNSRRSAGWFGGGWRCGLAAAVIVLVAGSFFTIGWFTSTRGDHDGTPGVPEISRQANPPGQGFRQDDGRRGPGQRQERCYPQGQRPSHGGSDQQAPSTPQAPSDEQTPSTPQTPSTQQTPSDEQGYLGVRVTTVTPAIQQQRDLSRADGALVASLDQSGPASQVGIRRGDVIISFDGTPVATQEDLIDAVARKNSGDSVSLTVDRDGQTLTFQVTLAARPGSIRSGAVTG